MGSRLLKQKFWFKALTRSVGPRADHVLETASIPGCLMYLCDLIAGFAWK